MSGFFFVEMPFSVEKKQRVQKSIFVFEIKEKTRKYFLLMFEQYLLVFESLCFHCVTTYLFLSWSLVGVLVFGVTHVIVERLG